MRLPRILNQCHPIPGFVYGQASFAEDEQAVLIPVRPRKRSAAICSGCHQPACGYDQSPTPRRFEFIGFWGYLVFLVYCMRRVNCKQCGVVVAYSGRCRSAFRGDGDRDSELIPFLHVEKGQR
jgi:transposase